MKRILAVIVFSVVSLGMVQVVSAESLAEQVAPRIERAGSVCVQGDPCAKEMAQASSSNGGGGDSVDPEGTYKTYCHTCHAAGVAGAPKFGNKADWAPRIEKGMDILHQHAINGFNAMPPKGTCASCSDADVKATVDYMVNAAK